MSNLLAEKNIQVDIVANRFITDKASLFLGKMLSLGDNSRVDGIPDTEENQKSPYKIVRGGRLWIKMSLAEWQLAHFPHWSRNQIKRSADSCVSSGALDSERLGELWSVNRKDQTLFYSVNDDWCNLTGYCSNIFNQLQSGLLTKGLSKGDRSAIRSGLSDFGSILVESETPIQLLRKWYSHIGVISCCENGTVSWPNCCENGTVSGLTVPKTQNVLLDTIVLDTIRVLDTKYLPESASVSGKGSASADSDISSQDDLGEKDGDQKESGHKPDSSENSSIAENDNGRKDQLAGSEETKSDDTIESDGDPETAIGVKENGASSWDHMSDQGEAEIRRSLFKGILFCLLSHDDFGCDDAKKQWGKVAGAVDSLRNDGTGATREHVWYWLENQWTVHDDKNFNYQIRLGEWKGRTVPRSISVYNRMARVRSLGMVKKGIAWSLSAMGSGEADRDLFSSEPESQSVRPQVKEAELPAVQLSEAEAERRADLQRQIDEEAAKLVPVVA